MKQKIVALVMFFAVAAGPAVGLCAYSFEQGLVHNIRQELENRRQVVGNLEKNFRNLEQALRQMGSQGGPAQQLAQAKEHLHQAITLHYYCIENLQLALEYSEPHFLEFVQYDTMYAGEHVKAVQQLLQQSGMLQ